MTTKMTEAVIEAEEETVPTAAPVAVGGVLMKNNSVKKANKTTNNLARWFICPPIMRPS